MILQIPPDRHGQLKEMQSPHFCGPLTPMPDQNLDFQGLNSTPLINLPMDLIMSPFIVACNVSMTVDQCLMYHSPYFFCAFIFIAVFQACYTTVFGIYSAFLFLRTGWYATLVLLLFSDLCSHNHLLIKSVVS